MIKRKFEPGDICYNKANPRIRIVIKKLLKEQKYLVGWYDRGNFQEGTLYECELELWCNKKL